MGAEPSDQDLKERKIRLIFISYGHDQTRKVELIKQGLEEKGYATWMDGVKIRPGASWRLQIQEGIRKSDVFIAFLSEHAMRDDGVCRDEIQLSLSIKGSGIKTVLLEPREKIKVPATINETQWLDLSQWDGGEEELPKILDDICIMVESDGNYGQSLDRLREIMAPGDCEVRKQDLYSRPMFGREWLYDALTQWDKAGKSNIFWILGGAGFGKSMFSANLCFKKPEKVVAAHFVEWSQQKKNSADEIAGNILKSLAFQLARRYQDYGKFILDLREDVKHKLFAEDCDPDVLCNTLFCTEATRCIDGGRESAWVLIDALDEATKDGKNPVAWVISQYRDRFPKWLKFVITSRDDSVIRTTLGGMDPDIFYLNDKIRQYQRLDMKAFLEATLAECHFPEEVYDTLIEKSEGMFLYLRYACEMILADKLDEHRIKNLPKGIYEIYNQYFERHFGDKNYGKYATTVRPILEIYCAAYEPLLLDFFAEVMDCDKKTVREAVDKLGTLKIDRYGKNGKVATFQFCHKSVWDWLKDAIAGKYQVFEEDGQKKLADFCLKKLKEYKMKQITQDPNAEYPLRYVIRHLVETENEEAIWELLGGREPQLPKLQFDYFKSYAASVSSLKTAILFYMDRYTSGTAEGSVVLPKIARLMVTCAELQLEQQKDLKKIFQSSSLDQTLDFMESIKDAKVYFCIGCYLLTKFKEKQNIDRLISAIEKKCGDQLGSIDGADIDFLGHGVFPKVIENMTAGQIIRLLRNIGDRSNATGTMARLKDQLNLPQAARACWYFDKLGKAESGSLGDHAKLPEEKERIARIQDADDRCGELIKLATNLYVHDDLPEAEQLLDEAVKLLKSARHLPKAAELYWNMGKTAEAGRLILDNHEIYGPWCERDFINDLCKFGLPEEAYRFFEKCILPDPEETADFLEECVSPMTFLKGLASSGKSAQVRELISAEIEKFGSRSFIDLLETMIDCGAVNDAAELLKLFCAQEGNGDCLFKSPKLLSLMRQLKDAGAWRNDIPKEAELKENFLKNYSLETVRDYWLVFSPDFSPEFQLELIREGWQCFLETVKDPELSAEDKAKTARDMGWLLARNSSDFRDKLAPVVGTYLERIKELSGDNAFFYSYKTCYYVEDCLNGEDTFLKDTLGEAAVDEFAAWCSRKITEAIEGGNFDRDVERYCDALLQYYFTGNRCAEAEALLNILPKSASEKVGYVFKTLRDVLGSRAQRPRGPARRHRPRAWQSRRENIPLPEGFMTAVDMACGFCSPQNMRFGDITWEVSRFFEELKTYREQPMAVRIGRRVWQILDELFRKTPFKNLDGAFDCLQEGSWCIPDEQFDRWLGKVKDYVNKEEGIWNYRKDYADVLISRTGDSEQPPENWYGAILDGIAKVTDLSGKNELLVKLLAVVIRKGTPDQQQEILSRLTDRDLTGNCGELRELDLERLYRVLTGGNVSDAAICGVVKEMKWKELPFEKLCLIAPHMVDEKEYTEKWFGSLFRKLLDEKEIETMQQIASECPELGLSRFCAEQESPVAAAALTAEKVAGMVPKMSEAILSLRKQLAEEELTLKGYAKRVGELLALLPEDTRQKYAELERALNEGDITEKGFAKQLTELLG